MAAAYIIYAPFKFFIVDEKDVYEGHPIKNETFSIAE